MRRTTQTDYVSASNLAYGIAAVELILLLRNRDLVVSQSESSRIFSVFTIAISVGMAYLVRRGERWLRYPFLFFTVTSLLVPIYSITSIQHVVTISGGLYWIKGFLTLGVTIMLFWRKKLDVETPLDADAWLPDPEDPEEKS